jgi:hypothetical protein
MLFNKCYLLYCVCNTYNVIADIYIALLTLVTYVEICYNSNTERRNVLCHIQFSEFTCSVSVNINYMYIYTQCTNILLYVNMLYISFFLLFKYINNMAYAVDKLDKHDRLQSHEYPPFIVMF